MDNFGCCYVSWGDDYIKETVQSAKTISYPTCLFTDMTTEVPENVFTYIVRSDFQNFVPYHYFYRKLIALQQTPFDVSLYLDGDTHCLGDIRLGFEKASKFEFATVIAPGQTFECHIRDIKKEFIHFNAGVLWYKGRPIHFVNEVLKWAEIFTGCDEPAWSVAWDELNINPAVLPNVFNLVAAGYIHNRSIRIWHSRKQPQLQLVYPHQQEKHYIF
jgi:hypothetical protein